MAKPIIKSNPRVAEIFNDLEVFLEFCQDYGYRYNESDLYNFKSYAWQQFNKWHARQKRQEHVERGHT
jgi:hypothetical protein